MLLDFKNCFSSSSFASNQRTKLNESEILLLSIKSAAYSNYKQSTDLYRYVERTQPWNSWLSIWQNHFQFDLCACVHTILPNILIQHANVQAFHRRPHTHPLPNTTQLLLLRNILLQIMLNLMFTIILVCGIFFAIAVLINRIYLKIDPPPPSPMKLWVYPKYVDFDGKYDEYDVADGCRMNDDCGAIWTAASTVNKIVIEMYRDSIWNKSNNCTFVYIKWKPNEMWPLIAFPKPMQYISKKCRTHTSLTAKIDVTMKINWRKCIKIWH